MLITGNMHVPTSKVSPQGLAAMLKGPAGIQGQAAQGGQWHPYTCWRREAACHDLCNDQGDAEHAPESALVPANVLPLASFSLE